MNPCTRPLLLVEDNEDDIIFMKRVLRNLQITQSLQIVRDGQQAVDYLAGKGAFADRATYPLPCLVLLDLKLPVKNGLEVLQWIRSEPSLASLVVLVLSTSKEGQDINEAYRHHANAYLVKPPMVEQLADMMQAIKHFWLGHSQFPSQM
jgi:CheY-like chemotaxis protein